MSVVWDAPAGADVGFYVVVVDGGLTTACDSNAIDVRDVTHYSKTDVQPRHKYYVAVCSYNSARATSSVVENTFAITEAGSIVPAATPTPLPTQVASQTPTPTATATLAVSSISPNSGPSTGSTLITISGTGFAAGAVVTFGSSAVCTAVNVVSAQKITCITPASAKCGNAMVSVKNPDGHTVLSGFTYNSNYDGHAPAFGDCVEKITAQYTDDSLGTADIRTASSKNMLLAGYELMILTPGYYALAYYKAISTPVATSPVANPDVATWKDACLVNEAPLGVKVMMASAIATYKILCSPMLPGYTIKDYDAANATGKLANLSCDSAQGPISFQCPKDQVLFKLQQSIYGLSNCNPHTYVYYCGEIVGPK